jgi:hypothetical protein
VRQFSQQPIYQQHALPPQQDPQMTQEELIQQQQEEQLFLDHAAKLD